MSATVSAAKAAPQKAATGPAPRRPAPDGPRPDHDPVDQVLALQRTIGNQATLRCLARGATPESRRDEQAADRTAEQVLAVTASVDEAQQLDPLPDDGPVRAPGTPLPEAVRAVMGPRLGYDLGAVRVHTGPDAARSARELGANAYTVGSDIVFGDGRFDPGTRAGRRLIAHELAHVVQQARGEAPPEVQRDEAEPDDPWTRLSPASRAKAQEERDACDATMDAIVEAQLVHQGAGRTAWLDTLRAHRTAIEAADTDAALAAATTAYHASDRRLSAELTAAHAEWSRLDQRYEDEHRWLLSRPVRSTDSVEAAGYLESVYRGTAPGITAFVADDDYTELKRVLDRQEYIRIGALRGARIRVRQLSQIMREVADLRRRGEEAEKFIPDWSTRVAEEAAHLDAFAAVAQGERRSYAAELVELRAGLLTEQQETAAVKVATESTLGKGVALVTGAVKSVVGIFVEAAEEAVDLGQIVVHFATFGKYDPTFVSGMAEAAEQGATTTDLLTGMVTGLVKTPSRFLQACRDGDWEAIGRESVNLYFLAKTIKAAPEMVKGSVEAARRLPGAVASLRDSLRILRRRTVALGLKTEGRFLPPPETTPVPPPAPATSPTLTPLPGRTQGAGTRPTGLVRDTDSPTRGVQVDAAHPVLKKGPPANTNEPPRAQSQVKRRAANAPADVPAATTVDPAHPDRPVSGPPDQRPTAMARKPKGDGKATTPTAGTAKTGPPTKAAATGGSGAATPTVGSLHPKTGHTILAEITDESNRMDVLIETSKGSMRGKLTTRLLENPGTHDPGPRIPKDPRSPYNPTKAVMPANQVELFRNSVEYDGIRYAVDAEGNIHQFQPSTDNVFHWAGSENGVTASGASRGLAVPSGVKALFRKK